jgi:flagellar biosynthesis/type III secretory pathway protein FliH
MNSLIRSAKLDTAMRILDRIRPVPVVSERLAESDVSQLAPENIRSPLTERPLHNLADVVMTATASSNAEADSMMMTAETSIPLTPSSPPPTIDELRILFSDELHSLREQATEQGYTEGLKTGRAEAQQQYSESVARLERAVAMLGDSLHKGIDGLTEIGAEVVFEAVTKIIGRSYIDRSGVTDVVKEVIRQAKDRSRLLIRVNPADYRELMGEREQLVEGLNAQHIEFAADDRVELGGCLLETPSGNLDGRLEVQLQQLRDTLLIARHRRTESVLES